ncbi:MAG: Sua5/YciO/YrdC/YwlC family protein [Arenicellales bacterium]|nr:Sua5/YciO/YrdC/YwlC family protein [Arenicellales bacterium]
MEVADLKAAAEVIHGGGIVAYPTEFCYGLGCDPRQNKSILRLLRIKHRRWQQGLILIAARVQQLTRYVDVTEQKALARAGDVWPGPYTWLMPTRPLVSSWLTGLHDTIAVRVTAHKGAAALCKYSRLPLISTSANRHGRQPARSAKAVYREFGNDIDYVLVGNLGDQPKPTQIRDAMTNKIVRE